LLAATPFFGWAADRFGRRLPMVLGLAGMVLATLAFAFAQQFWQLVVARIAQGVSGAASWVIGFVQYMQ
jgi:MFS family permease